MKLKNELLIGLLWCILAPFLLPCCTHRSRVIAKKIALPYSTKGTAIRLPLAGPPPITIWIHGTRFRPPFDNLLIKKGILRNASILKKRSYTYQIATILDEADPTIFPLETFYSFTWSGGISNQERLLAAQLLYTQLQHIIAEYMQKWEVYPVIRMISHSHGGNVALNMVKIEEQTKPLHPLIIDTFIMLACPVQNNTMHLTQNSMFHSIYSLYSSLDMVQVIAPQRFYGMLPFSYRKFPKHANIIQAKIRMNGHAVFHTEFTTKRFFKSLPLIIKTLQSVAQSEEDEWKKQHILLRINTRGKNVRPYHRPRIQVEEDRGSTTTTDVPIVPLDS